MVSYTVISLVSRSEFFLSTFSTTRYEPGRLYVWLGDFKVVEAPSPKDHSHSSPEELRFVNRTVSPARGAVGLNVKSTCVFLQAISAQQSVNNRNVFFIFICGTQPMYFFVASKPSQLPLGVMTRVLLYQFDGTVKIILPVKISE